MHPVFVWDTSALINWHEWYPADRMPHMWHLLDGYVEAGRLYVPSAVVSELGSTKDGLAVWIAQIPSDYVWMPSTEDLRFVKQVQAEFPALAPKANRPGVADGYVVAAALSLGGTVVTDERSRSLELGDSPPYSNNKRMDAACSAYGVECVSSREFMRQSLDEP